MIKELTPSPIRAVLASVQLPTVSDEQFEASLMELGRLAKTLGYEVVGTFKQQRPRFHQSAYLGNGKRKEVRRFVQGLEPLPSGVVEADIDEAEDDYVADDAADALQRRADILLVDHEISPTQARNLEKAVGCEVMDRTMVILEIFHRHARSRAAKAQVEIVRLGYLAPRMREAARLDAPQGRQRSGVGGRGSGESRGELDRRKIRDRIAELQESLVALDAERKTQRERRQAREGLARVALVGYTNAGKSTLMRALTGSDVLVADKLFATLDTTVRALHPATVPRILVSDTVGFIENLPHGLVASFKSTLDETLEAGLLLHVIDASDSGFERQLAVTERVLEEIEASSVPRMLVFNKIDRVGDKAAQEQRAQVLHASYPDCVVMSARSEADVASLHARIRAFFQRDLVEAEILLPWSAQQLRAAIFTSCEVLAEDARDDGAFFRVRGDPAAVKRIQDQLHQLGIH